MKNSKNKIGLAVLTVLLVSLMGIFGVSCGRKTKIVLDKTEVSLCLGESVDILAENPNNSELTWTVEDGEIVSIVASGNKVTITALAIGNTVISAEVDGGKVTCSVTVKPSEFYINLPKNCLVLKKNHTASVQVLCSGALPEVLTWKSSDETVATVEAQNNVAIVTAVKRGECEITVSGGGVVKTFTVIVGIT